MAKITWLGEDDVERDIPGPSYNVWAGIKFYKGQPVEISDQWMIASAKQNQFYKVEEINPQEKSSETQDQGKEQEAEPLSLEQKAQALKERLERKEPKKDYDYREAEKVSGYTPKKKKGRPKKPSSNPGVATPDT
jgi:hypothetical protein